MKNLSCNDLVEFMEYLCACDDSINFVLDRNLDVREFITAMLDYDNSRISWITYVFDRITDRRAKTLGLPTPSEYHKFKHDMLDALYDELARLMIDYQNGKFDSYHAYYVTCMETGRTHYAKLRTWLLSYITD